MELLQFVLYHLLPSLVGMDCSYFTSDVVAVRVGYLLVYCRAVVDCICMFRAGNRFKRGRS